MPWYKRLFWLIYYYFRPLTEQQIRDTLAEIQRQQAQGRLAPEANMDCRVTHFGQNAGCIENCSAAACRRIEIEKPGYIGTPVPAGTCRNSEK